MGKMKPQISDCFTGGAHDSGSSQRVVRWRSIYEDYRRLFTSLRGAPAAYVERLSSTAEGEIAATASGCALASRRMRWVNLGIFRVVAALPVLLVDRLHRDPPATPELATRSTGLPSDLLTQRDIAVAEGRATQQWRASCTSTKCGGSPAEQVPEAGFHLLRSFVHLPHQTNHVCRVRLNTFGLTEHKHPRSLCILYV